MILTARIALILAAIGASVLIVQVTMGY